jgi:hypothetical protein
MRFIAIVLLLLFLAACGGPAAEPAATPVDPDTTEPTTNPDAQASDAYPAAAYPGAGYPDPDPDAPVNEVPFEISEPLNVGDMQVSGSGPGLVPIRLISITNNGRVLAERVIPGDGQWTLQLVEPLEAGDELGLLLGNPGTPDIPPFIPDFYNRTEGAQEIEGIGIVLDTATVQE